MRVSKRDFLKMVGLSAGTAVVSANPAHLPKESGIVELPTTECSDKRDFFPTFSCLDARDAVLYDSVEFQPGQRIPRLIHMFQYPLGHPCGYSGEIKAIQDTNMYAAGYMPAPMSFWARTIHVAVSPDTTDADEMTARKYAWELYLYQKRFASGPCILDVTRASIRDILKKRVCASRASMSFPATKGLYLPTHMPFNLQLSTSRDGLRAQSTLRFIVAFEGVEWRGVQ